MPQIRFEYLIATWVPGFPVAVAVFLITVGFTFNNEPLSLLIWTPYIIGAPLAIGLIIDGLRHTLELLWFSISKNWRYPFFRHLSAHEIGRLGSYESEAVKTYLLDRFIVMFHMFEFFFNFSVGCFLTWIILHVYGPEWYTSNITVVLVGLCVVSFILSLSALKRANDWRQELLTTI